MSPEQTEHPIGASGRSAAVLLVWAVLALAAGCGARRPEPVTVSPPADARDTTTVRETPPWSDLEPVEPPPPPRPWLPLGVRWSPPEPREGDAVGIRLLQPAGGRAPVDVEGSLGERPVHFVGVEDGWFGVASAPIGSDGAVRLELRYRLSRDSVVTRTTRLEIADRRFPATRLSVAPRYSDPGAEALARIREERRRITALLARATPDWLPRGGFVWPRETRITSPFGQRRVFNQQLRSRHTGVDLSGATGAPVRAPARGRVALTGNFYFAGNAVYLDHGLGVYTGYFHLSRTDVEPGEIVEQGDLLGGVGATGRVTGPHLHWSLYVNGASLDASSLLRMEIPPSPRPSQRTAVAGG